MDYSKFSEPSNLPGEWTHQCQIRFWHNESPFAAKYAIEKMTGILLTRDAEDSDRLSYTGVSTSGAQTMALRLRFQTVIDSRSLYLLLLDSSAPRKWISQEAFLKSALRTHEFWSSKLELVTGELAADTSSALYKQRNAESLMQEGEAANLTEDLAPIAAIQQAVLHSLRVGKTFRTAHKEGGSILAFTGGSFRRTDYGEDPKLEIYLTDEAMLTCLRSFYDWESRRDTHPHRPLELAVWTYIQGQLRD